MIITQIYGGIGNQMFQYAFGRCLAHRSNTKLKLDISLFKKYKLRKYELGVFNIDENFASLKDINKVKYNGKNILERISQKFYNIPNQNIILEKQFHFDPDLLNTRDNVYLQGYWQSEKYFQDIEEIIREEFTFKKNPVGKNLKIFEDISSSNSISIHIRRGDYVSNSKTNKSHGICSIEYYRQSINLIIKKIKNPVFYIFSDDISWAKKNFAIDCPIVYVDHNSPEIGYEDLRLLSACKHHIIANSSFSWWGAWLSNNKSKIVIAPKKWFDCFAGDTKDLIPVDWLRV